MDSKLYDLCMEVRRRTNWIDTDQTIAQDPGNPPYRRVVNTWEFKKSHGLNYGFDAPLYTSDYLLGKLPKLIVHDSNKCTLVVLFDEDGLCTADYQSFKWDNKNVYIDDSLFDNHADTPREALLKLVIALDDAGRLK